MIKKTTLTILALITVAIGSFAQNVTIPDANFKTALLSDGAINTVNDNEISVAETMAFNGKIDVPSKSIASLVGIV